VTPKRFVYSVCKTAWVNSTDEEPGSRIPPGQPSAASLFEPGPQTLRRHPVVFGDLDGVCVIPRAAEEEVFRRALEKVQKENLVGQAIQDGMSAQEAFKKFGVM
jgi:hypothetical protein